MKLMIVLLLATVSELSPVLGQQQFPYQLTVYFHQYNNPSHSLLSGLCCEDCIVECDSTLYLCVRFGDTSHDNFECPTDQQVLGSVGGDSVTFADVVGSVENPVVINLSLLPDSGYQLLIVAFEPGTSVRFIIDRIFIEIPVSELGQHSPQQTYFGEQHVISPVMIVLSYSLECNSGYQQCTVNVTPECVPDDECINGGEIDGSTSLAPSSHSSIVSLMPTSVSGATLSIATSTILSVAPSATSGGAPLAAIVGSVVGLLVLVLVTAILVVVSVAVYRHRSNKPGPTTDTQSNTYMYYSDLYRENSVRSSQTTPATIHQQPVERNVYEEIGNHGKENTYEVVDLGHNPESTLVTVVNPTYQTSTLTGSRGPAYEDLDRTRSDTLTEVTNAMYAATTLERNEQPKYEETQVEVKNALYEDQPETHFDPNN